MTAPSHADIIDKLQKLRVLAHNKAAMPGEIEAALRAMSALMARYRITEAELEAARRVPSEVRESEDLWPPAKRIPSWRIVLLSEISRPNGVVVHVVAYDNKTRGVRLAGTEKDVAIVTSLWAWLEPEAVRLSWFRANPKPPRVPRKDPGRLRKSQMDWIIGFAMGVSEQLEAELHKPDSVKNQAPTSAALVLIDQRRDEAKNWLARIEPEMKPLDALKGQKADQRALAQGFEAGERYHLGKKLSKGDAA